MSRFVSVCLCAIVVFATTAGASLLNPMPALAATGTLKMETPLQQNPDPAAPVVALLSEGTIVSIDGPPVDGFYPVTAGDLTGWMRGETMELAKDVTAESDAAEATPDAAGEALPLQQEATDTAVVPQDAPAPDVDPAAEPPATGTAPSDEAAVDPATADPPSNPDGVAPSTDTLDTAPADPAATDTANGETVAPEPTVADTPAGDAAPVETATDAPTDTAPVADAPAPTPDPNVAPIPVADPGRSGPASAAVDAPLRVGPGRDFDLITTIPAGETVEQTGNLVDGYVSVQFSDVTGWVAVDHLGLPGSKPDKPKATEEPAVQPTPEATAAAVTTATETPVAESAKSKPAPAPSPTPEPTPEPPLGPASVIGNVPIYDGPGPDYGVIFTVPDGSTVEQTGQMEQGFISVRYKEISGWAAAEQLTDPIQFVDESIPEETAEPVDTKTPRPGSGVAYTTVDLSLRAGPSATEDPITVVPAGSRLVLTGVMEGDFQRVTYGDQIGWVSNEYLNTPENPAPNGEGKGKQENYSEREIIRIIYQAADKYDQDRDDMLRVARCESNLDPYAVNPSGSYGLFQFIRATWKSTPYGDKDIFDPSANAHAAAWMWSEGRKSEWVCQ